MDDDAQGKIAQAIISALGALRALKRDDDQLQTVIDELVEAKRAFNRAAR